METIRPFIEHIVIELYGLKVSLRKRENIHGKMNAFVEKLNLNIIKSFGHNFFPEGFTEIKIVSESHIAFHSWPEKNYLNIDILSCKKLSSNKNIKEFLNGIFNPIKINIKRIKY